MPTVIDKGNFCTVLVSVTMTAVAGAAATGRAEVTNITTCEA